MDLKHKFLLTSMLMGTCALLQAAPILRLSQTALGPFGASTGANATSQTIYASNIGDGSLNLVATSSAPWLSPSVGAAVPCPGGSGTCVPIQVALNTATLPNGTYTEFLTISDPRAIDAPQTVSVTVQVGGVPNSIDLYVAPDGGTATSTVQTRGAQTATVSTQSGGNFLSVTGAGTYGFFTPFVVTATSQAGQAAGNYTGAVTFSGSSFGPDNVSVPVVLHVTSQPVLQLVGNQPTVSAVQGASPVTSTLSFTNSGSGTAAINGVSTTGGFLTATTKDASSISFTATPGTLAPGTYNGSITLSSNAANAVSIPVVFTVRATSAPVAFFGGVVDNAIGQNSVSPGDIASIYGDQFTAQASAQALKLPLPTVLAGTSVLVNGTPAPLYYASNGQINFQIPTAIQPGQAIVTVQRDGLPGNQVTVNVVARSPKILNFQPPYRTTPVIVNQDGTIPVATATALPNHSAKLGDTLTIYMIGLGSTSPAVPDGVGAPSNEPLARVDSPVMVTLGGGFTPTVMPSVLYAGLTPTYVGLYQVNFTIPQNAPVGDRIPVMVGVGGASSNPVYISITK